MRQKYSIKLVMLIIFFFSANISFAQNLFVWGQIEWNSGTPAVGLEVQLVRNGDVIATNYSNTSGRYGFFNINGNPSDYEIDILLGGEKLKHVTIPEDVAIAGKVPKIIVE